MNNNNNNIMTDIQFLQLGHEIVGSRYFSEASAREDFMAWYGTEPHVVAVLWSYLSPDVVSGCQPKHFLWALHFLKSYDVERNTSRFFRVDRKTYRKWTWYILDRMTTLSSQIVSGSSLNDLNSIYVY